MAMDTSVSGTSAIVDAQIALSRDWRRLIRFATFIAVLTSPSVFIWYHHNHHWSFAKTLFITFITVLAFRGAVELIVRRYIPWPSLFGSEDKRLHEEDVVNRRRAWTWRFYFKITVILGIFITIMWYFRGGSYFGTFGWLFSKMGHVFSSTQFWLQLATIGFLFMANFLIFMGPLVLMGYTQIKGFEPGDADWGVKLDDVRGQAEAKEDIRRVVSLWQSGEIFEGAGGKRERGLLFVGAPGTGKTMLAKAIATGFNSPFVSIPGSGFAATFIGIDAVIVRLLAAKARRLARKWGGQCIVFIDEIDAVGMRRQALVNNIEPNVGPPQNEFFGPWGAINESGDLIRESAEWREWLFRQRAGGPVDRYPGWVRRGAQIVNQGLFPGMGGGGGGLALNQLLIVMDGIGNPPFLKRLFSNRLNTLLDACFIFPRRVGRVNLRFPRPKATASQIYFIGATNVPLDALDPALTRPGRMGRHIQFRTPTKTDRQDIFDLYLGKVAHDPALDTPERRDEIARITNGYSPAMIDQICSMALTKAHHEGRPAFGWDDLMESMTVIEAGTAIGFEYTPDEAKSTAVHEAGHAVAAHIYHQDVESSRLSIRRRGRSGGHHQTFEKEERFLRFQSELRADLIHTLGAMAAEIVFYGENTQGVGGDLQSASRQVSNMVGGAGMAPMPIDLKGKTFPGEDEEKSKARVRRRFEDIGLRLVSWGATLPPGQRKNAYAAQILGEAFTTVYNAILVNKAAVDFIAETVMERQEIFGDELVRLLDSQNLIKPDIDWTDEASWPVFDWSPDPRERGGRGHDDLEGPGNDMPSPN